MYLAISSFGLMYYYLLLAHMIWVEGSNPKQWAFDAVRLWLLARSLGASVYFTR